MLEEEDLTLQGMLKDQYGLEGQISSLQAYNDPNYMFVVKELDSTRKYVVKILNQDNRYILQLQKVMLDALQALEGWTFPRIVLNLKGESLAGIKVLGELRYVRVLTYIQGLIIDNLQNIEDGLFVQIGQFVAHLSTYLQKLSHNNDIKEIISQIDMNNHQFNLLSFAYFYQLEHQYLTPQTKPLVQQVRESYEQYLPLLQALPKQLLHNDLHLSNLIVQRRHDKKQYKLTGLIDFGEVIYECRLIELAGICAMSVDYTKKDKCLDSTLLIIKGYARHRKLQQKERRLLFPLMKIKLAYYLLSSCYQLSQHNNTAYMKSCYNCQYHNLKILTENYTPQQFQQLLVSVNTAN